MSRMVAVTEEPQQAESSQEGGPEEPAAKSPPDTSWVMTTEVRGSRPFESGPDVIGLIEGSGAVEGAE
jgi:hypothetical protein